MASIKVNFCTDKFDADGSFIPFAEGVQTSYWYPILEINASTQILANFVISYDFISYGILISDKEFMRKQLTENRDTQGV
jgi:hypothetical protein